MKTERLKKLEVELRDLEQWLSLGLVPKKDLHKHEEEIGGIRAKIEDEKERLRMLKETGDTEEYAPPKRQNTRSSYQDTPSMPDLDIGDQPSGYTEVGVNEETEVGGGETENEETTEVDDTAVEDDDGREEENPFSDRQRWRRGIADPDADEW